MRSPSPNTSDSPRIGEEQGSTWQPGPLQRVPAAASGPETYALFRPSEVLYGPNSSSIRRLEAEMVGVRLGDVYDALALPWQIDRKDVNGPFGSDWTEGLEPDFWVSTDTGKVCFAALEATPSASSPSSSGPAAHVDRPGQYHKEVGGPWQHFASSPEAPGDRGGFHCCVVSAGPAAAPRSAPSWTLVAKLADFGLAMGRDAGLRVEFAALVRDDCEALVASLGPHDECRSLFCVDEGLHLPAGTLLLADPAELADLGGDGPAVPSGLGAGRYPVYISKDEMDTVCRITVAFHPVSAGKVSPRFPPFASSAKVATAVTVATLLPVSPSPSASSTAAQPAASPLRSPSPAALARPTLPPRPQVSSPSSSKAAAV
eukprot:CAMPEP_0183475776 /NCGR_PEP_ID=MMETSP0370-20130417/165364_1 /TAXON_ID=268820 /ORGANISM="Peridinium aciculiferum, Strain PAER-2" /LENGTH=372 /DNA_ID=CAMNT_0025668593 /DNA_START=89 /DNA_END=1203 /DNA_ORIENTATION=-